MEKNVYQILQDWHELLKTGAITETEFAAKKSELLGTGQKKKNTNQNEELIRVLTPEEQAQSDAEYDLLFNNPTWFQKNKSWIIGVSIAVLTGFSIWYFINNEAKSNNSLDNSNNQSFQTSSSYYKVNADEYNLVHFYRSPDIGTQKAAYFNSISTVYVQKIENGFGYIEYTNDKGQTSKGWVKMQDLQSCTDCEK